jgi:hypothetical protein
LAEKIHTIPRNLPDIISLPISLSVAVAVDAGEVQSVGGATVGGTDGGRWTSRAAEIFSASSSSSSASSTPHPIAALFSADRQ